MAGIPPVLPRLRETGKLGKKKGKRHATAIQAVYEGAFLKELAEYLARFFDRFTGELASKGGPFRKRVLHAMNIPGLSKLLLSPEGIADRIKQRCSRLMRWGIGGQERRKMRWCKASELNVSSRRARDWRCRFGCETRIVAARTMRNGCGVVAFE